MGGEAAPRKEPQNGAALTSARAKVRAGAKGHSWALAMGLTVEHRCH